MAKITNKETGRPSTSYKSKFLELQKKYNNLLEIKVGIAPKTLKSDDNKLSSNVESNDTPIKKEVVEALKPAEATLKTQSKEEPEEEPEENLDSKELELEEEPEKEEINSDDYDFRCSSCKELFNKEGNELEGNKVKCPDCGEVYNG